MLFLNHPEPYQALGRRHDRFFVGARRPIEQTFRFGAGCVLFFPSSGRICLTPGSRSAPSRTIQFGSCQVGTFFATAPMRLLSTIAISRIERKSPAMAGKRY